MTEPKWQVRLGAAAELDFANILQWTKDNFGARQAGIYRDTLVQAIRELADGPGLPGSRARDELMPGVRTLHVAPHGRRGSHFLLYRVTREHFIEAGRILHERMDIRRHLPFSTDHRDK
jgi:toxin ParE1/3/4